jgi:hypothetical protein
MTTSDNVFAVTHSHFCDGSPEEVAEDMKKQLDANPNTIQVSSAVHGVVLCCCYCYCISRPYFYYSLIAYFSLSVS